jgi:hypothetical protein
VVSTALGHQAGPEGVRAGTKAVFQICAVLAVVGIGAVLTLPVSMRKADPALAHPQRVADQDRSTENASL